MCERIVQLPPQRVVTGQKSMRLQHGRIELQHLTTSIGSFLVAAGRSETESPWRSQKKI
jgi:hypothetical protein